MEENKRPEFGTRDTGMFVPEGFFEEFQKNLEKKIDLEVAKKQQRSITLRRWSIAASICLILGLSPVAWSFLSKQAPEQQQLGQIAEAVAETEVEAEDVNSEDIIVSSISDLEIYEMFYANL